MKISDFGLARKTEDLDLQYEVPMYELVTFHRPLPVRWLAPECLVKRSFSQKSDVWSFGVVIWEMVTGGGKPYSDLQGNIEVADFVQKQKGHPSIPDFTLPILVDLMKKCWQFHTSERPTFTDLKQAIEQHCGPGYYITPENFGNNGHVDLKKAQSFPETDKSKGFFKFPPPDITEDYDYDVFYNDPISV